MSDSPKSPLAKEWLSSAALVIAVAVSGLILWHASVRVFDLPKALLPTPGQVWDAAVDQRQALLRGTFSTGVAAISGLLAAVGIGCVIATVFSLSRRMRLAFFPYVIFLQTVPIVAIAPLLIIWSGYTFRTVVIVTVIVCLFPIINSVTAGLLAIDRDLSDLFRLYGANQSRRLFKLQIPSAIGDLMIGTKTSSGLAVIGAIVAEFFVGNGTKYDGLGTLMTGWQALTKTDALIAAIFASAILGLMLFGMVQLTFATFLGRWTR